MFTTIKRIAFAATVLCTASIAAQADILNGIALNGIALNTLTSNKITTNGLMSNRIATNGLMSNKLASNALISNALISNRIVLNGVEGSSTAKAVAVDFGTLSTQVQLIQWLPNDKN